MKHRTMILALETKVGVSLDLGSWIVLPNLRFVTSEKFVSNKSVKSR